MIITHYNREMQRIRFFFFFVQRSVSFVSFIRLARHSKRTEQFVNIRSRLYIQEGEVSRVFLGQDRISFEATVSRELFGMSFILLEWIFSLSYINLNLNDFITLILSRRRKMERVKGKLSLNLIDLFLLYFSILLQYFFCKIEKIL